MVDYTDRDLSSLLLEWERIFGKPMPRGFEVSPDQVPIIRECIEKRSTRPLSRYVESLPGDISF